MMAKEGDFQRAASRKDLKEGGLLKVEVDDRPIILAMVNGKIYAMDAVCSHEGGPLEEGTLQGYELKCPWHYAIFDVRNAKVSEQTMWATDLQSYPARIDESTGEIFVSLQTKQSGDSDAAVQQAETDNSQKKYYEEAERKHDSKLSLELIATEKLQGTDMMTFRLSREGLDFTPGQYAFFKIDGVSNDPKGAIRHFSIASSPTEEDLLISTRIRDTPYKQKLASLSKGTRISAWGPEGEFVLQKDHSKPAVLLSGGIGVTPFRSMIKYATDKQLPVKITMLDSNRNSRNILYKDEFDKWASQNSNLKIVYTITDDKGPDTEWAGERGRINKSMLERHLTKQAIDNAVFYICGPPGMLKAMQELLKQELKIPEDRLRVEVFTGY